MGNGKKKTTHFSLYAAGLLFCAVIFAVLLAFVPRSNRPIQADAINATGEIHKVGDLYADFTKCLFTANLAWSSQNASQGQVTVRDEQTGEEKVFSADPYGSGNAPWLKPNGLYTFTLWNTTNGGKNIINRLVIPTGPMNCAQNYQNYNTNAPYTNPAYYQTNPYPYYGTGGSSGNNFNLTFNNNVCVGQAPIYTITGANGLSGQTIYWTSIKNAGYNGMNSGNYNTTATFMTSAQGNNQAFWTGTGNVWTTGDVGSWTKTATINGITKTLQFTVKPCGTTANIYNTSPYNYPGYTADPNYYNYTYSNSNSTYSEVAPPFNPADYAWNIAPPYSGNIPR